MEDTKQAALELVIMFKWASASSVYGLYIIHTVEEDNIQDLPYLVDRLPVHDHRLVAHQRDMGHFLCILHSDKDGPQEILWIDYNQGLNGAPEKSSIFNIHLTVKINIVV